MPVRCLVAFAIVLALSVAAAPAAAAGPVEYSYEVARFEADGNILGLHDGAPDFIESSATPASRPTGTPRSAP